MNSVFTTTRNNMAFSKRAREDYNKHRERISKELGINKNEYNRLRRTGAALHRHDEDSAMGRTDWRHQPNASKHTKEYDEKSYKKDVGHAFAKSRALLKAKKINVYHQQDPRGASLYAAKKRIHRDRYSSEGHVIY